MPRTLRFDTLLVRALARELNTALGGARLRTIRFDRAELRAMIGVKTRTGPRTLVLDLAPAAAGIRIDERATAEGNVRVPRDVRIRGVEAAPDDRLLTIVLGAEPAVRVVIELITNQWNVVVVAGDGRIVRALRPRGGERPFRPGVPYEPPPATGRAGATAPLTRAAWHESIGSVAPAGRRGAFVAAVAYASPLNAAWVLGDAEAASAAVGDDAAAVDAAYDRYVALVTGPVAPALLGGPFGAQPYPHPLGGEYVEPMPTLLAAFAAAAAGGGDGASGTAAPAAPAASPDRSAVAQQATAQAVRLRKRADRLRDELRGAAQDAAVLRADADLLLAQLHRVERGAAAVTLDDFAGGTRNVELDPMLGAAQNAERLYAAARKRDRAAARLPALVAAAERDAAALEDWAGAVSAGSADPAAPPLPLDTRRPRRKGEPDAPLLPYRTYRTSGGLEVRVGRSSRANDELTLRHASPNDVWLHARDVAGAHVVIRWADADANPSQRDLAEAGVLAALYSRARTSGVVAVDWTRRKYVRKPRRSPPGAVTLERAKTIFVEPDPAVEARLAGRDG